MTRTSISVCRDPRAPHWQLGPLPPAHGRLTLLGWSCQADTRDAGVPRDVARVLVRALTSVARLTFPCSRANPAATGGWSAVDGDMVRVLDRKNIGERVVASLRGLPATIVLLSTSRPETAMRLFEDEGFPWWLQGQIVFLSEPDAAPPDLDEATLLAMLGDAWATRAGSPSAYGVEALVSPGVDGDVAGLLSLTDAFDRRALAALERETLDAGLEWVPLSESAFPRA